MPQLVSLSDTVTVAPQIAVAEVAHLAQQGYKLIINNRPDHEDAGQPTGADIAEEARRHGVIYQAIPITAATLSRADVEAFRRAVAGSPGPVLAYCRTGTRCCLVWSLGEALAGQGDPRALVDAAAAKGFNIAGLLPLFHNMKNG